MISTWLNTLLFDDSAAPRAAQAEAPLRTSASLPPGGRACTRFQGKCCHTPERAMDGLTQAVQPSEEFAA